MLTNVDIRTGIPVMCHLTSSNWLSYKLDKGKDK